MIEVISYEWSGLTNEAQPHQGLLGSFMSWGFALYGLCSLGWQAGGFSPGKFRPAAVSIWEKERRHRPSFSHPIISYHFIVMPSHGFFPFCHRVFHWLTLLQWLFLSQGRRRKAASRVDQCARIGSGIRKTLGDCDSSFLYRSPHLIPSRMENFEYHAVDG